MSSNPADRVLGRAPHSITARLAVLFAASACIMLFVSTGSLYLTQTWGMEQDDAGFVIDKVHRLERALQEDQQNPGSLHEEVNWRGGPREGAPYHAFYSRILDGKGRLVIETAGMAAVVPGAPFPSPVDLERITGTQEKVQRWRSPEGRTYCLLTASARNAQSGHAWVIQVAMDDFKDEDMVSILQFAVLAVVLLGALVSAGIGGVVARRCMRPLRDMAAAAERITVSRLDERIDVARQPDELATLAAALNRTLVRLEDSVARMSQFAADVAHELRTPIHNLKGEAEVVLSIKRTPEEYRDVLESSLEEFDRLSSMIDKMLFIARAENPQQQIERVRFDARREIDAVVEFFEAMSESRGVMVIAQGQGVIDADRLLFRRALTNLLSNALRHTPSGGRIVLTIEQADDATVQVKVIDSGFRAELLPGIADRPMFANRNNARVSETSGLGLMIVKSIVELHAGAFAIDSAPGKGTSVVMCFPAPAPAAPQSEHVSAPDSAAAAVAPQSSPSPGPILALRAWHLPRLPD